jgi:hypothetical protein
MIPQPADSAVIQWNDSCAPPRLRRPDNQAPSNLGDLLNDEQALTVEIDVLPPEPDDLAPPQAGGHQQAVQSGQPILPSRAQEDVALFRHRRLGSLGILRSELDV